MKTFALLLALLAGLIDRLAAEPARLPNIVIILADDLGWGSLGCYGARDLRMPACDRLAREGRRFTQAYAPGSVCSPTRYGLMTGRYYWRTSVKDGEVLSGNAPLHIETNRVTLASLCKSQGYRTGAIGKWHLGLGKTAEKRDWSQALNPGPLEIGFDHFLGLVSSPSTGPYSFYIENHDIVGHLPGEPVLIKGKGRDVAPMGIKEPLTQNQVMQTLTARATAWLEQNRAGPFFLYFAPNAVHRPITPGEKFTGSRLGPYGDFAEELDWSVGEVLNTLDRLKLADNTLVIFTSDNGGAITPINKEAVEAIGKGLAINGPLRGGKHDVWEGGFREPFLVRWPGHVPAGTVSDQVICLTDVLATLAGLFHAPLPDGNAEDSFDVMRAFTEAKPGVPVRDHVILQAADATYAIRSGDWKLIERKDPPPFTPRKKAAPATGEPHAKASKPDELFNLAADPAESQDVAAGHPEIGARLRQLLTKARADNATR